MGCFPCCDSEREQLNPGNVGDHNKEEQPMVAPQVERLSTEVGEWDFYLNLITLMDLARITKNTVSSTSKGYKEGNQVHNSNRMAAIEGPTFFDEEKKRDSRG
ncbi:hypothetical protein AXF42_Ash014805 [Apostasia shenzhenica]|uniref:Uncharacterized protein n=1 Tax=Apostasia shenzhenica TaxID=1088818 RepID=A0A2H9ZWC5_9ASPA|nr:hypothetical protein AXF42_Ash014805 [Apostasia shenzhenica]